MFGMYGIEVVIVSSFVNIISFSVFQDNQNLL